MRISDWSSDVCSSDLAAARSPCTTGARAESEVGHVAWQFIQANAAWRHDLTQALFGEENSWLTQSWTSRCGRRSWPLRSWQPSLVLPYKRRLPNRAPPRPPAHCAGRSSFQMTLTASCPRRQEERRVGTER